MNKLEDYSVIWTPIIIVGFVICAMLWLRVEPPVERVDRPKCLPPGWVLVCSPDGKYGAVEKEWAKWVENGDMHPMFKSSTAREAINECFDANAYWLRHPEIGAPEPKTTWSKCE